MSLIESKDKERIWNFFVNNFMSMPSWLRNTLIVSLLVGGFYFFAIRPLFVFSKEKQNTEKIFKELDVLNQKIVKIEEIRIANEDMIYNIEEVRGIVQSLSELHHNETAIMINYIKNSMPSEEFQSMKKELDKCDEEYRNEVYEMFIKKSKEHLRPTTEIVQK